MLRVLFFGRVRESLGCASLELPLGADTADLDALQRHLCATHGAAWAEVLGEENIIRAINHEVADGNPKLSAGDEIAFFPPVTGG